MEVDNNSSNNSDNAPKGEETDLKRLTLRLQTDLKTAKPNRVPGIPDLPHELAPFLPKERWTRVGDAVKEAERPKAPSVPGNQWISLRCDGTGFSKYLKTLRLQGVMQEGFSDAFASIMQDCCQTLLDKFNAKCGFTQSDELTILIPPQSVSDKGVQQAHAYNGRVQKLCSLAAATVTAKFNHGLFKLCQSAEQPPPEDGFLATFDCRVGAYDSLEEALSLILWRAYDSGVNGVSDAVHQKKGRGKKYLMEYSTVEKLRWLHQEGFLPLPRHQREGSYYVKRKILLNTTNRATGEPVSCLRSRTLHIEGNVIRLFQQNALFPADESLPPDANGNYELDKKERRKANRKRRRGPSRPRGQKRE